MYHAISKNSLRQVVNSALPVQPLRLRSMNGALLMKPAYFSLYKATRALDFNKMFKVNKITARSINEISNDLYMQYLANLQDSGGANAVVSMKANKQNAHTARVLRKYVKLLRTYFTEVYENKLAKQIPASSAMH